YGAQTKRSIDKFQICFDPHKMPKEIIYSFAMLKQAAAQTIFALGILAEKLMSLLIHVCEEILAGNLENEFPLVVWQTGSGTQTNMNINEVIANRGHVLNGGSLTDVHKILSENDHVNKSQSSNDTFPTAMYIAAYRQLTNATLPALIQ